MKKTISIILSLMLLVSLLAGCTGTPVVYYTNCTCPTGSHTGTSTETTPVTSEGAVKTGLAIVAGIGKSENAKQAEYDALLDEFYAGINKSQANDPNPELISLICEFLNSNLS